MGNSNFYQGTLFSSLNTTEQKRLEELKERYRLSYQQIRSIIEIHIDLMMWGIENHLAMLQQSLYKNRDELFLESRNRYEKLKRELVYTKREDRLPPEIQFQSKESGPKIFGKCPVASDHTVCCNLYTIDILQNCGLGCSYCTIQSFYQNNTVLVEKNIDEKLRLLETTLDPEQFYHFGTGQSSDSLLFGNLEGSLDHLMEFARRNKNVILELKTKSKNINYFLENDIPRNVIISFSLNSEQVSTSEEHFCATVHERLDAAKKLIKKFIGIGFHFHPMIISISYQEDYLQVFKKIQEEFNPEHLLFISFGTLTYIKPVLRSIRMRRGTTQVLQLPLVDAHGKFSYPLNLKEELFSFAYQSFSLWHDKVFFYLCMEDRSVWEAMTGKSLDKAFNLETEWMKSVRKKLQLD